MGITIVDIARKLKVSHSTVSRVLNDRHDRFISNQTRQRVLTAAHELGYRPNRAAQALVTGRTGRVAFWAPDLRVLSFHEMIWRFHRLLRTGGYEMIAGEFDWEMADPTRAVGFTRMDVDGVLIFGGALGDKLQGVLESNFPDKVPIVNMGLMCHGSLDYVRLDPYPAAKEAMGHLTRSGCRRIIFLGMPDPNVARHDLYRAYAEGIGELGGEPELVVSPEPFMETVRSTVREYVRTRGCPDAVFCMSDEYALGAFRALRDLGKNVPEEVRVVGGSRIEELDFMDVPISTIIHPVDEMCRLAWEFLHRRMEEPEIPQQTATLTAEFVLRKGNSE